MPIRVGGQARRALKAARAFSSRHPALLPLATIAAIIWVAWFIGIRTRDRPTTVHSLGLVAQVQGDRGTPGRNEPVGCSHCGHDLMRYGPGAGLRVDMVVSVHPHVLPVPSCGKASVDLVISGTPGFWAQHNRLDPGVTTRLAVGWDHFTRLEAPPGAATDGAPALIRFFRDPQAALHPGFFTDGDLLNDVDSHRARVVPSADAISTQISGWDGSQYALHLHFKANWLETRGFGSCYVLLPDLLANGAIDGTQSALRALAPNLAFLRGVEPPTAGRTALAATGPLTLSETSPTPTDFEAVFVGTHGTPGERSHQQAAESGGKLGPVWSCEPSDNLDYLSDRPGHMLPATGSFTGDACGAVAVIDAPGAGSLRAVVLTVFGVLLALAFEWLLRRAGRRAA